ncbi:hypothetical protein Misp01_12460 [Microtetraspora sp. NBRC 13810]|uniref:DUF6286 domain-containing protein n=1 Tax=Microtetraspora sp. NBRC 13810 TaxID=3030990 RepID=UPI0024A4AE74|nr:DUF6286 domain-containing protein [Microtetraspora sp. NBRC 13810]GLW06116.1 hypothetical protein Misp01_12460 [Microtetraspora sp. NBRC 13810]
MTAIGADGRNDLRPAEPPAGARYSRRANRAAVRAFRPRRAVPGTIAAIVLLLLGLVSAIEVISALLGTPFRIVPYDRILNWAFTTRWNNPALLLGAGVAAILGLLLLLMALVPGRGRYIALRTGDPNLIMGMQRRSFARSLARAAESVDGVTAARGHARGGYVHVKATTPLRDTRTLEETVRRAIHDKIDSLSPASAPHVGVTVRRK